MQLIPADEPAARRQTRRRGETRRRMLDAAAGIVERDGLSAATVESVCAQAGFTRGAFYSNFATMDDLLLALFRQRAEVVAERLAQRFDEVGTGSGPADAERLVEQVLQVLPLNRQWYQVSTEMTAQALRRPEAAAALREHRSRLRGFLHARFTAALRQLDRTPVTSVQELTDAVLAMYEGTLAQAHLDGRGDGHRQQLRLLTRTVLAMTEPARLTSDGPPR